MFGSFTNLVAGQITVCHSPIDITTLGQDGESRIDSGSIQHFMAQFEKDTKRTLINKLLTKLAHLLCVKELRRRDGTNHSCRGQQKCPLKECSVHVLPVVRVCLLEQFERACAWLSKWRIHQHYVVTLMAKVHESESSHSVIREESPLQTLTVLRFLRIETKSFDHLCFSLFKELSIGDVLY
ncbi:MAG: hypothetical protein JW395_1105 [Nitrospira sp.]|nr:hypothetical protein [Nitrospira sp.]